MITVFSMYFPNKFLYILLGRYMDDGSVVRDEGHSDAWDTHRDKN